MTTSRANNIRRVCSILLSVSIIITGVLFAAGCIRIYQTGDQPFSRESVAAAFSNIAIPVYFCLGMVMIGFVADWFLPADKQRISPEKYHAMMLHRLHSKIDLSCCEETLRNAVTAQQRSRKRRNWIAAGLLVAGSVIFLGYAVNGQHFHQSQINASMLSAMAVLIPCLIPACIAGIFAQYKNRASIREEILLLKQAESGTKKQPEHSPAGKPRHTRLLRTAILIVALTLLAYGFLTGGTSDVLTKAINICTECVGLG